MVKYRQFDVFPNPDVGSNAPYPFLIILQSDAVAEIGSRVIAPLIAERSIRFLEKLMPPVTVLGRRYVIAVPDMASIPISEIGKPVANLEGERYHITAAVDLVFTGI